MNNATWKTVVLAPLCFPIFFAVYSGAEEASSNLSPGQTSMTAGYYDGASVALTLGYRAPYIPRLLVEIEGGVSVRERNGSQATTPYAGPYPPPVREPKESGQILDAGMNFGYLLTPPAAPVGLLVFGGPRFAQYEANYQYPGDNSGMNVEATSGGVGTGLRFTVRLGPRVDGVFQMGVDYYFPSSPYFVNHSVSANYPLADSRDADALSRADLPRFRPRVMMGVQFP
jgi:hypothetical protein